MKALPDVYRAQGIGFQIGRLAGSGYFDPARGPWPNEDVLVAWLKATEGQLGRLETATEPGPVLDRLERLLDGMPTRPEYEANERPELWTVVDAGDMT